jgi:hypothetical protein
MTNENDYPIYAVSDTGTPLVSASIHPEGARVAMNRASSEGAQVYPDRYLIDGHWLLEDIRKTYPIIAPVLTALLLAILEHGQLLATLGKLESQFGTRASTH